jgi:hypothetical protein
MRFRQNQKKDVTGNCHNITPYPILNSTKWKSSKTEWVTICPACDAYALGIELTEGFPFKTHNGEDVTIHEVSPGSSKSILFYDAGHTALETLLKNRLA